MRLLQQRLERLSPRARESIATESARKSNLPTGIPHHCRCIVAGRLLAGHKTLKNDLHTLQFVTADRSVSLGYSAYDEMGSRLAVLE